MATELIVVMSIVVPDTPDVSSRIRDLHGREMPGVPGSYVTRIAIREPAAGALPTAPEPAAEPEVPGDGLTDDEREAELAADLGLLDGES